jgi:hypothetical protein
MSKSLDPLKKTAQELHRFYFMISTPEQWYGIMKDCRREFGRNWACQSKVLRKLKTPKWGYYRTSKVPFPVWFDIPNQAFATWIAVKFSIEVRSDVNAKPTINN